MYKKIAMVITFCCFVIGMSACGKAAFKEQNVDAQTGQSSKVNEVAENTFLPPKTSGNEQLIYSTFVGKTEGWFLYKSTQLDVYHSSDNGQTWEKSPMPIKQPWEKDIGKENVFVSLHANQEAKLNWILLTSGPAAGQMGKSLYQSVDNGKSWTLMGDFSETIDGYVTGITFRNDTEGWIAASQHGKANLPLYRTQDGGKTWTLQEIGIPKDYKYGNAYPPSFDTSNDLNGTLKIEFVADSKRDTVEYTTKDGGKTWIPPASTTKNTSNETQNTDFSHYNSDPIQEIIYHDAKHMQTHLFDNSDSVWIDGDWHDNKTNLYGPRYVSTYVNTSGNPPTSVIEELDLNSSAQGYTDHVCPKSIGHITITVIDSDGPKKWMLIHFKSSSGVNGTLDLSNNHWTFNMN